MEQRSVLRGWRRRTELFVGLVEQYSARPTEYACHAPLEMSPLATIRNVPMLPFQRRAWYGGDFDEWSGAEAARGDGAGRAACSPRIAWRCLQLDGRVRLFVGDRELTYGTTRSEPSVTTRPRPPRPPKSSQGKPRRRIRGGAIAGAGSHVTPAKKFAAVWGWFAPLRSLRYANHRHTVKLKDIPQGTFLMVSIWGHF